MPRATPQPMKLDASLLLFFAALFLLPISRLVEVPLVAMAVLGAVRLWREGLPLFMDRRAVLLTSVFLAYWIPILVSAFDAVHPEKTWLLVVAMPRYWLAGLFVLEALRNTTAHDTLWRLCAWLLVFWTVDALIQAVFGYDLLGYPYPEEPIARINGVFGLHNFKLGPVLALFSPLLIEHARRYWPAWATALALLALVTVVLLTTTRIGWVFMILVALVYLSLYGRRSPRRTAAVSGLVAAAVLAVGTVAYFGSDSFRERVDSSMRVIDGTRVAWNEALGERLPIWDTSLAMAGDHWFNGVGARGYRYAYPQYANASDPWVRESDGTGATYAHQLVLEILSETGAVGLLGFVVLVYLLVRSWRRAPPEDRVTMFPYAIALMVAVFPLNSHYATYATGWSIALWWLVMAYCAASPRVESEEMP